MILRPARASVLCETPEAATSVSKKHDGRGSVLIIEAAVGRI